MRGYGYYLFDMDNTIVDSSMGFEIAYRTAFEEFGMDYDPSRYNEYIATPLDVLFAKYYPGCTCRYRDFASLVISTYDRHYTESVRLFPDAERCIRTLRERGGKIGIVSNSYDQHINGIMRFLGVDDCFDAIVGLETSPVEKPNPYPVRLCMSKLGAIPEDTIMIGDSKNDIFAGSGAGIETALISRCGDYPPCTPTYRISDLGEIL